MDGVGAASSDILGIELGRNVVRGVLLDEETAEIAGAAECAVIAASGDDDEHGFINPTDVGPSLDDLLYQLGIEDRAELRVGLSVGPKNSGVGSGPALPAWLEQQSVVLREPLLCAGDLGIAFVPAAAVDAAVDAAGEAGLELLRVDLAPVAAARVLGDEVEDAISIGSGRGWRARLRDFEVLEAMETTDVDHDDPLRVIRRDGLAGPISRYSWVEISPELRRKHHLDLGQLAPAVGAAIGVAYGSPANLLVGRQITGDRRSIGRPLGDPEPTGRRRPRPATSVAAPDATSANVAVGGASRARRAEATPATGALETPDYFGDLPRNQPESTIKLARIDAPTPPEIRSADDPGGAGLSPLTNPRSRRRQPPVDESDPINLFSPDTDLERELARPDGRLDLVLGFFVVLAVALLLVYLFL